MDVIGRSDTVAKRVYADFGYHKSAWIYDRSQLKVRRIEAHGHYYLPQTGRNYI